MKTLLLLLLSFGILPCSADLPAQAPAPQVQEAYSTQQALDDVLSLYRLYFAGKSINIHLYEGENLPHGLQLLTKSIHPKCEKLRQLSSEQLRQVCMLADAILWQSAWIEDELMVEHGIDTDLDEMDIIHGFEKLAVEAEWLRSIEKSPEREALLREFGGEATLDLPARLLQERWAKDYKTAFTFYKEFCAAACEADETTALSKLRGQAEVLSYFQKGGELEMLRVNSLAHTYINFMLYDVGELPSPARNLLTPARMQALEPFFTAIPALKPLLFDTK